MRKILNYISVSRLFVFLNYAAIFIGLLNTYFRPKVFSIFFSESNFAFLTVVYGISLYLAFLDGGISKPIYSILREKYIKGLDLKTIVQQSYSFYSLILFVAFIVFSVIVFLTSFYIENSLTILLLFLLSINLVLNFHIQNLKNIITALDEYEFYQKIEVVRRISNLVAIFLIFIDTTFILGNIIANLILLFLIIKIKNTKRIELKKINIKEGIVFYKNSFYKAKNFFFFTIFEILIYNSGFILVPIFYNEIDIIQFGLLITVYNGIALFSRSIIDISIHSITKKFLENKKKSSLKIFNFSILSSILFTVSLFSFFSFFLKFIFDIWVGEKYIFSTPMLIGLLIFLVGNSIQHISGTILLSIKNNYKLMRNISAIIFLFIVSLQNMICYSKLELKYFFLITAILYFFGSFIYLKKVLDLYKN